MKNFLIKFGVFTLSVILLFTVAYFITGSHIQKLENDFMAAMVDKHQRAEEIGSPKLIIAGGSNVAFNFDSERIEQELGLPVVNLGLSVGLGMNFIVNEIIDVTGEGDIIIFSITFFEDIDGMYSLKRHTAQHFPKASRYFRLNLSEEFDIHSRRLRDNLIAMVYRLMGRQEAPGLDALFEAESIYTRAGFNKYGDFTAHYGLPQVDVLGQRFTFDYSYWAGIEELNRLHREVKKKGAQLFYLYPAYPTADFERNREVLTQFDEDMRNGLTFPILGEIEDSLYPETLFFDTAYHLQRDGVIDRTKYLIGLIRSEK